MAKNFREYSSNGSNRTFFIRDNNGNTTFTRLYGAAPQPSNDITSTTLVGTGTVTLYEGYNGCMDVFFLDSYANDSHVSLTVDIDGAQETFSYTSASFDASDYMYFLGNHYLASSYFIITPPVYFNHLKIQGACPAGGWYAYMRFSCETFVSMWRS